MGNDSRKKILDRRAQFVVAALASAGIGGCERPQPCLSAVPVAENVSPEGGVDAGAEAPAATPDTAPPPPPPMPCLSPMPPPPDAGTKSGGTGTPDAGPPPMPCLKVAPPMPCLDMPPPP